jgi:hypothetical protein
MNTQNLQLLIKDDPILQMAFEELTRLPSFLKYCHPDKKVQAFIRKELKKPENREKLQNSINKILHEEITKRWLGFYIKEKLD